MLMEINSSEVALGIAVIKISGRVMLGKESEQITDLVRDLLREGKRTIIFDIAEVVGIDSTGIGRFISSYNQIAAAKGQMRLAGARSYLYQVFHVSSLDKVFRFYPTLEEACQP